MTTGCAASSTAAEGAGWVEVLIGSPAEDPDHEPADHKVHKDDEHRGDHHRLGSGTAHTLGATARVHAVETANAGNNETENNRLHQALKNIRIAQRLVGRM